MKKKAKFRVGQVVVATIDLHQTFPVILSPAVWSGTSYTYSTTHGYYVESTLRHLTAREMNCPRCAKKGRKR